MTDPLDHWIMYCSWRYCGECGRLRPHGLLSSLTRPRLDPSEYACSHKINDRSGCSMKPGEFISATELRDQACGQLDAVAAPVRPMDPGRVYVTPSRDHWPDLLLGLTEPEARSLAIVDLYCDFKRQRGQKGTAPVSNYKKLSVVRAEWRSGRVEDSLPTDRARAAYAWLLREIRRTDVSLASMSSTCKMSLQAELWPNTSPLRGCCCTRMALRWRQGHGCILMNALVILI